MNKGKINKWTKMNLVKWIKKINNRGNLMKTVKRIKQVYNNLRKKLNYLNMKAIMKKTKKIKRK